MKKMLLLFPLPLLVMGWVLYKTPANSIFKLSYTHKADKINSPQHENRVLNLTTLDYTLDASTIFITPAPSASPYAAADFTNINYPLICEAYTTDATTAQNPAAIHANAAGVSNVFYGGALPAQIPYAAACASIFTKQVFNSGNFPITLETSFYCDEESSGYFNEGFFWLGAADRQYYSAPSTLFPDALATEGIVWGGTPNRTILIDKRGPAQTTTTPFTVDTMHYLADFAEWYDIKTTFDTMNGAIMITDLQVNSIQVFDHSIVFAYLSDIDWEDNFRIALLVDDLAHGFKITYNDLNTSVKEIAAPRPDFRAYPVPAQHQIQVDFDANLANINNLYIMDASGKQFSLPYELQSGKVVMDLSDLPAAAYWLVLQYNDNQRHSIPFTKQP